MCVCVCVCVCHSLLVVWNIFICYCCNVVVYFCLINKNIVYLFVCVITRSQARLRLADVVEKEDVNEALRLLEMSKKSLYDGEEMSSRFVHRVCYSMSICLSAFSTTVCVCV